MIDDYEKLRKIDSLRQQHNLSYREAYEWLEKNGASDAATTDLSHQQMSTEQGQAFHGVFPSLSSGKVGSFGSQKE